MNTRTALNTSEIGRKINNMATALKLGPIWRNTKAITSLVRNTVLGHSNGEIIQIMWVNFITTIFMVKDFILGLTAGSMKENGKQIRCMEREHSLGLMAGSILVSMLKIKKEATVNSSGQIDDAIEENGLMESNMAKEHMLLLRDLKNMENG
jgi:hypothetical protein